MKKQCVLMVGLPGSGKSTKVASIIDREAHLGIKGVVCSTDDFFMVNGRYQFDGRKLMEYHARNFQKFALACADGIPLVIVDNTNIMAEHREPYIKLAQALGYEVHIEVVGEFTEEACQTYAARNTHGVPLDGIRRMASAVQLPERSQA
jgi:predicted kinase